MSKSRKEKSEQEQVLLFELPRTQVKTDSAVGFSKVTVLAKGSLSLNAQRILRLCASQIREDDPPDKVYSFSIADFAEIFNLSNDKIHTKIKQALVELAKTVIILPIERGRVTSYISWGQIYDAKVEINLDPALKPFYQKNLSGKYPLQYIRGFSYSYTYRFYELFLYKLKQSKSDKTEFYISVDELREWLRIEDSYKNFADLRKRIIIPIVADINGEKFSVKSRIVENDYCNLQVEYEEVKAGRKVLGINFTVTKKENMDIIEFHNTGDDEMPVFEALNGENKIAFEAFKKWKVSQVTISDAYKKYGSDKFYKIYLNVLHALETNKVRNVTNYAANSLRNGFTYEAPEHPKKEDKKETMEVPALNPDILLETEKIKERIANMSDEEKEIVLQKFIKSNQNNSLTLTIISGKTFDEITSSFMSRKLLIEFLRKEEK